MIRCVDADVREPDVIVVGGGPAGATTATLIAQQGYAVRLLEREHFPRYHVGESLIPETFWVLDRLGILPKLRESRFVKKHSVQFVTEQGRLSAPFYFSDHKPHESSQTWQVLRQDFDQLMLDHARESGVDVREGVRVLEVIFEGSRAVGVRTVDDAGVQREMRARVVVDAAGQSGIILDRLGLREWDPVLKKAAIWTYWKGAHRDPGRDEGATLVMQTEGKKGWFWYIPLHDDVVSVGVVAPYDYLFTGRASKDLERVYFEEVARCPGVQPRIATAERVGPLRAAKEYSYRSREVAGDGWVLVGDAFGFLDPLYSSGILLALKSGACAADAISEGLARNDTSAAQLGKWGPEYIAGMERMRRLVCEFYDGLNFGRFVRENQDRKGLVTDILIGDIFKPQIDELWPLMDAMKATAEATSAP
ncbi:MAG TPA: NAD(P)/FAD-dependent oxidoreductase [Planctomycetaceae bacterium]|nr:NAD(P)/FAD-dependent oxidoreductase [Planctomycetaceae bacterium]